MMYMAEGAETYGLYAQALLHLLESRENLGKAGINWMD